MVAATFVRIANLPGIGVSTRSEIIDMRPEKNATTVVTEPPKAEPMQPIKVQW